MIFAPFENKGLPTKRAKNVKKKTRPKMEFSDLKYLLVSGIFLSRIGGYPPPPLNGKSSCPKTLSGNGGYPPTP